MPKKSASVPIVLCLMMVSGIVTGAQQIPDWGNGVALFAFAFIGDMPYGDARETRLPGL